VTTEELFKIPSIPAVIKGSAFVNSVVVVVVVVVEEISPRLVRNTAFRRSSICQLLKLTVIVKKCQ
jgi:hypothetical protein